ncbi:MAG: holdfast anchor protein HfaD [Pseudomonadota bacterium]
MTMTKTPIALAGLALMAAQGPAHGQEACDPCAGDPNGQAPIVIDQVQIGDLSSAIEVDVDEVDMDASATATTAGNTAAGLTKSGDIEVTTTQRMEGEAAAAASLTGDAVAGAALTTATAYGNAASAGTWMGNLRTRTVQTMTGDVAARSDIELGSAGAVSAATTGIGNVAATDNEFGDNLAYQEQASDGSVAAQSLATVDEVEGAASFATTAGGNVISSTGYTATAIQGAVQTTRTGEQIEALTEVSIAAAGAASAVTTASGNAYTLNNEFGYASLGRGGSELFQGNDSQVAASSVVTALDFGTYGVSSAYGVGNSAAVTNLGSDTALYAIQSNYGNVGAQAQFTGASGAGGVAQVSSVAVGNTATAGLCITCGPATLTGTTRQFSASNVAATGSIQIGQAGSVVGSATAIGNAATFQTSGQ